MKTEIRPLTGLRGLAACWVAAYHIFWLQVNANTAPQILRHGYIAVDIFFVLSGFVMTMNHSQTGRSGWSTSEYFYFILRRIGRVWPVYILTSAALLLLMYIKIIKRTPPSWEDILANVLLIQSWVGSIAIDEPSWSVSAEILAYALFPLLLIFSYKSLTTKIFIYIIILIIIYKLPEIQFFGAGKYIDGNGDLDISSPTTIAPILRCLAEFLLGIIAFSVMPYYVKFIPVRMVASIFLYFLFLTLLCFEHSDFYLFLLIPFIILAAATSDPASNLVLGNSYVYKLGCWSYSLYLIHFHSNNIQSYLFNRTQTLIGSISLPLSYDVQFAMLIIASAILYNCLEKPFIAKFRRLEIKLRFDQSRETEIGQQSTMP